MLQQIQAKRSTMASEQLGEEISVPKSHAARQTYMPVAYTDAILHICSISTVE